MMRSAAAVADSHLIATDERAENDSHDNLLRHAAIPRRPQSNPRNNYLHVLHCMQSA